MKIKDDSVQSRSKALEKNPVKKSSLGQTIFIYGSLLPGKVIQYLKATEIFDREKSIRKKNMCRFNTELNCSFATKKAIVKKYIQEFFLSV